MSRVSMVLAALGAAVFALALAEPVRSRAAPATPPVSVSVSGPMGDPELIDVLSVRALLPEPVEIAMLPASPAAPPAPTPPPVVLGISSGPGTLVIASWYGPGFYGNRTACGQVYTPEILGVAHRTLPCGTPVRLEFAGRTLTVPVIDRGPFIAGRTLDLSNAVRAALACTDLCPVRMQ